VGRLHGGVSGGAARDEQAVGAVVRDPADAKPYMRRTVAQIVVDTLTQLELPLPELSEQRSRADRLRQGGAGIREEEVAVDAAKSGACFLPASAAPHERDPQQHRRIS